MPLNVVVIGGVALGPKAACRIKRVNPDAMLRKDIFEIARYGTDKGLRMCLATNGTLPRGTCCCHRSSMRPCTGSG